MILFSEFIEIKNIRNALKTVNQDAQKDGLKVWWHPKDKKAYISVGDWADSKGWFDAVKKVVGRKNVDGEPETSPGGEGWISVHKYRTIGDSLKPKKMAGFLNAELDLP